MAVRSAEALWTGSIRDGNGTMKVQSGSIEGPYSFPSRFEEGKGTNPEELLGASHAGCFSMALSGELGRAGFKPTSVHTTAKVHIDRSGSGFEITKIELQTEASVPEIDDAKFQEIAASAKQNCPVSKALAAVAEISLQATLNS